MLQLTLVAVDGNEQRSIDLEVNLDEMREEDNDKEEELQGDKEETEAGELVPQKEQLRGQYLPLDDQIDAALADNSYGKELQTAMQSRIN